jgi:MSHA pilin protein MshD
MENGRDTSRVTSAGNGGGFAGCSGQGRDFPVDNRRGRHGRINPPAPTADHQYGDRPRRARARDRGYGMTTHGSTKRRPTATKPLRTAGGFTLMEALIASVILSVVVVALTQAVLAGQQQTYDALLQGRGMALAEAMMEEVLSKPYADPEGAVALGPDAGETSRALHDNMDDFHNLNETAGNLRDAANTLYPTLFQVFTRVVSARYTTVNVPALGGAQNCLEVTVTVSNRGRTWTIVRVIPES